MSFLAAVPYIRGRAILVLCLLALAAGCRAEQKEVRPKLRGRSEQVQIENYTFVPGTVAVAKGATVTWTNQNSVPHTVTADTGAFDSERLEPNEQYRKTFSSAGTFSYHCEIHPDMKGEVVVR